MMGRNPPSIALGSSEGERLAGGGGSFPPEVRAPLLLESSQTLQTVFSGDHLKQHRQSGQHSRDSDQQDRGETVLIPTLRPRCWFAHFLSGTGWVNVSLQETRVLKSSQVRETNSRNTPGTQTPPEPETVQNLNLPGTQTSQNQKPFRTKKPSR